MTDEYGALSRSDTFDELYQRLSSAWESHEILRSGRSHIQTLAQSRWRLDDARNEMWDWWRANRKERSR